MINLSARENWDAAPELAHLRKAAFQFDRRFSYFFVHGKRIAGWLICARPGARRVCRRPRALDFPIISHFKWERAGKTVRSRLRPAPPSPKYLRLFGCILENDTERRVSADFSGEVQRSRGPQRRIPALSHRTLRLFLSWSEKSPPDALHISCASFAMVEPQANPNMRRCSFQ